MALCLLERRYTGNNVCVPVGPPVHRERLAHRFATRQQWPEQCTAGPVCPCVLEWSVWPRKGPLL